MAVTWHIVYLESKRGVRMLPFLEFFKTAKGVGIAIAVLIVLMFLVFRSCNKFVSEVENETIEIIEIDVPMPGDYDANCVRLTGKPCPKIGK